MSASMRRPAALARSRLALCCEAPLRLLRLVAGRGHWPQVDHIDAARFGDVRSIDHIAAMALDIGLLGVGQHIEPMSLTLTGEVLHFAPACLSHI